MRLLMIFTLLIPFMAFGQLEVDWDMPEGMNCDNDGGVVIQNSGRLITFTAMEGVNCSNCYTSDENGTCVLSPGQCSSEAGYFFGYIEVTDFAQVGINMNLIANTVELDCSGCNTGDEAKVSLYSSGSGLLYTTSMCGYETTQSFSGIFDVACEDLFNVVVEISTDEPSESYSLETVFVGIGTAPEFPYPEVVSFEQASSCKNGINNASIVVTDCEDCSISMIDPFNQITLLDEYTTQINTNTFQKLFEFTTPEEGLWPLEFYIHNADNCPRFYQDYYVALEYPSYTLNYNPFLYVDDISFELTILDNDFNEYDIKDLSSGNTITIPTFFNSTIVDLKTIPGFGDQIGLTTIELTARPGEFEICEVVQTINIMVKECKIEDNISQLFIGSENFHFEAQLTIESTSRLLEGTQIIYDAGESITLNQDFEVSLGASFEAIIDGCDN